MRFVAANQHSFVPASHEDPRSPGVWKRVVATQQQLLAGRPQMINWARLPFGRSFRKHYHEDMEEAFLIIQGQATMLVDDQSIHLQRGDAIFVAPREVHQMTNTGDTDVEYIVLGITLGQGGKTVLVE